MSDAMLIINSKLQIPRSEFLLSFARSSGPGGQNVNKVNSKVTLRWAVGSTESLPEGIRGRFCARHRRRITRDGELVLTSQRYRDQPRNIEDCLEKLRQLILEVAEPAAQRKPTRPTRGSQIRRLEAKQRQAAKKRDRKALE